MIEDMKNTIKLLTIIAILTPSMAMGANECVSLKQFAGKHVFPENVDVYTYCNFINEIEKFRQAYISKFGEKNWKEYKYSRFSEDNHDGATLGIYDIDIHKIYEVAIALNKVNNILPKDIKTIKVDNSKFTRASQKWIFDESLNITKFTKKEIIKYTNVFVEANDRLQMQSSPNLAMKKIHKEVTDPIVNKIFHE